MFLCTFTKNFKMKTHLLFTFVVSILINQAVYSQSQAIDFTLSSYTINIAENIQTSYNTSEDVSVTLNSQPSSNVTVTFNPTVFDQITITPTQLEFTPSNWNTPQTVEISAVSDGVNEGEFTVVKVDVKSSITIHDSGSGDGSHDSGSGDGSHDSGSGDGSHDSGSGDGSHDSGSGDGSTDDGSTTYENTKLLTVNVYDDNSDELVYIRQSSLFQATTNANYPYVFNAAKKLDGNNGSKITFKINITSLPNSGATYRVLKSVANGNTFTSSAKSLTYGLNTITIAGVSFDRFVKIQFSSGSIAFDSVILNGTTLPDNAPPNITSASNSSYEVVENTTSVGTLSADEFVAWSISGADSSLFSVSTTGELAFKSSPDFENPSDDDSNNIYNIVVAAADTSGNSSSVNLTVTVKDTTVPDGTFTIDTTESELESLTINWTYIEDGTAAAITGFKLWVRKDRGGSWSGATVINLTLDPTLRTYKVTGLTPDSKYSFRLWPENSEGFFQNGQEPYVSTLKPNTAPDNIADIDVKIGYDAVDFTVASGITDPDGDSISLIKVTTPANGTVSLTSAGDVIYSPNDNFYGADSFSFKISDGTNETTVTLVTIDVIGLSDLNGDGSVDTVDLTFLASHIVGIVGYELPASYENVFDVNQDGEINTIDLVYLASYIVGVEGYNLNIKD